MLKQNIVQVLCMMGAIQKTMKKIIMILFLCCYCFFIFVCFYPTLPDFDIYCKEVNIIVNVKDYTRR